MIREDLTFYGARIIDNSCLGYINWRTCDFEKVEITGLYIYMFIKCLDQVSLKVLPVEPLTDLDCAVRILWRARRVLTAFF